MLKINQNQVVPTYKAHTAYLAKAYEYIKGKFNADYVDQLCKLRGYTAPEMRALIQEMQLGACELDSIDIDFIKEGTLGKEVGLITSQDNYLLSNRYIIPVYDIADKLVTLIGYYPDVKKYITVPSPFFSKDAMFFNFRQAYDLSWSKYDGFVILVEGIFDCLSLRSIGLPCIATMGSTVSGVKCELLKLFNKVLAIPDNDTVGRKAIDMKKGWQIPSTGTFLKFKASPIEIDGQEIKIKDMDDFVKFYEAADVREVLLSYKDSRETIEELCI